MNELKCPHCGAVFSADEANYASILSQVRTAEFEKELKRRTDEMAAAGQARKERDEMAVQRRHDSEMAAKDRDLATLRVELERMRGKLDIGDTSHRLALEKAIAAEKEASGKAVGALNEEISRLRLEAGERDRKAREDLDALKRRMDFDLAEKDRQIEQLRDMKMRLSTKMVGESLEQHCSNEFNSMRAMAFPNAYFEKDNDASSGTKGDFIFRDYDGGMEYISIMFEMKNEMDTTAAKHRNEDFFEKLDRDRRAKGCEYAVLVSLLEADNEFYNRGIVDVSYRYDKMYVIRPQFFIPVISMLSRASRKSVALVRELELARNQSVDVTNFEIKLDRFKKNFNDNIVKAQAKYEDAISRIDRAIKSLEEIKKSFEMSERYLLRAGNTLEEDITVRKLTHGNKTMREKFAEARKASAAGGAPEIEE